MTPAFAHDIKVAVVRVKVFDFFERVGNRRGESNEKHIDGPDVIVGNNRVLEKVIHCFQKFPSGVSNKTTGCGCGLSGVEQREYFEELIIVPSPPGSTTNATDERVRATLRVKKYFIVTKRVVGSM